MVISKPPQTPPVHERRHSRRGSSSSLSSLIHPNGTGAQGGIGGPVMGNGGAHGSQASLPPIKRPLMPPHAEAVGEENESLATSSTTTTALTTMSNVITTAVGPMKTSTFGKDAMPPLPPNATNKPTKLASLASLPAEVSTENKPPPVNTTSGGEIE